MEASLVFIILIISCVRMRGRLCVANVSLLHYSAFPLVLYLLESVMTTFVTENGFRIRVRHVLVRTRERNGENRELRNVRMFRRSPPRERTIERDGKGICLLRHDCTTIKSEVK